MCTFRFSYIACLPTSRSQGLRAKSLVQGLVGTTRRHVTHSMDALCVVRYTPHASTPGVRGLLLPAQNI